MANRLLNNALPQRIFAAVAFIAAISSFVVSLAAQNSGNGKKDLPARVLVVPLDDRPATTQFVEMIGNIGNAKVILPPRQLLGTFIAGGKPDLIAEWLLKQDFSRVDAAVLSIDMLAYGGFMTSRFSATPLVAALNRLKVIEELRRRNPNLKIYAFNTVRRVALSATAANRPFRDKIARWSILADETEQKPNDASLKAEFERLRKEVPATEIADYLAVRKRNLQVNFAALEMAKRGVFNRLLLLQDDAHRYGLHRPDGEALRRRIAELNLTNERVAFYNGADEGASVLLSRAVLEKADFKPRVRIVYSSEAGRTHLGDFEDQPIETSVRRQIENSGARIVEDEKNADYTLYVSAPEQTEAEFETFVQKLVSDVKNNRPVAIADVLYKVWGGGDVRIVERLGREKLIDRVIGYASWGTPGNAIGTVVPQANLYVFARQKLFDDPELARKSEIANVKFLFHRWVGDYGYHVLVRPAVNKYARQDLKIEVDEFDAPTYEKFNRIVVERMTPIAHEFFDKYFKNNPRRLGDKKNRGEIIEPVELQNLKIRLPWARTFEVFMDFDVRYNDLKIKAASGQKVINQ